MTKYQKNEYGIEEFEIQDVYVPDVESDDDSIYQLMMTYDGGDSEIYCSSGYERNLENIQVQLEKQFKLIRK